MGRNMVQHLVWIVPYSFFPMCFVSEERYFRGDKVTKDEKLQEYRKTNAAAFQSESLSSAICYMSYELLAAGGYKT